MGGFSRGTQWRVPLERAFLLPLLSHERKEVARSPRQKKMAVGDVGILHLIRPRFARPPSPRGEGFGRGKPRPYIRYIGAAQMVYGRRRRFEMNPPCPFGTSHLFRDTPKIRAIGDGFLVGGTHACERSES